MTKTPISVYLITCNEAAMIEQVLTSISCFDEIIVVDSGSTDGTIELAEKAGARVIHQDWLGFAKQKAFALSLCKNEWCLNIDGDEVVPVELAKTLQTIADEDTGDAVRLYFEDIFMGGPMHRSSHKRSIVRFFKKSCVRYPEHRLVHENVSVGGRVINEDRFLVSHYGYASVEAYVAKQNSYSSLGALEKFNRGKSASLLKLVCIFPLMFIKEYIVRKMFLSGYRGLIHAFINASYAFLKEAKLYELGRKQ